MELPSQAFPNPALPRGTWRYTVDVQPRDALTMQINGGATGGSYREIVLALDHTDALAGRRDIADMFVWGDVDPNYHPRVGAAYSVNNPIRFASRTPLLLSAGAGTKTINVRLRFMSGRTIDQAITYALAADTPHVSILRQPYREFMLSTSPVSISWSCSHSVSQIYVGLANDFDTPRSECAILTSGTNVNTGGSWAAGEMITSSFVYADALAASLAMDQPLSTTGQAFVKVFAVTPAGETS